MKTKVTKKSDITRDWHLIDAEGQVLGRVATQIAGLILGKHKPYFTPNLDCGDKVVVINSARVRVTGKKAKNKTYWKYSGYPSGLTMETFEQLLKRIPTRILEKAVWNMLPKNRLRKERMHNLYIYAGSEHPHGGQLGVGEDTFRNPRHPSTLRQAQGHPE